MTFLRPRQGRCKTRTRQIPRKIREISLFWPQICRRGAENSTPLLQLSYPIPDGPLLAIVSLNGLSGSSDSRSSPMVKELLNRVLGPLDGSTHAEAILS